MLKKINISESEISHILSLHKRLNEGVGFIVSGKVLSKDSNDPIYDVKVTLRLEGAIQKQTKTNSDGEFAFNGVQPNKYALFVEGASEGLVDEDISISVVDKDLLDTNIYLKSSEAQGLSEVDFISVPLTIIDFMFVDTDGVEIPKVGFSLYDDKNQIIGSYSTINGKSTLSFNANNQSVNGTDNVIFQNDKQPGFFYSDGKFCTIKRNITVVTNSEGFSEQRKIEPICIKNGSYNVNSTKNETTTTQTPRDNPKKKDTLIDTNIIKISLSKPKIESTVTVNNKKKLPIGGTNVNIYLDEDKKNLFKKTVSDVSGKVLIELTTKNFNFFSENNKQIPNVTLYFEIIKEGYVSKFEGVNLIYNDKNDKEIVLSKSKPIGSPDEERTIGAIKTTTINGDVNFKIALGGSEFKDSLPKVFIRMTNKDDRNKFFETESDEDGLFEIKNVPYGVYDVLAIYGNKNNGFIYENKEFKAGDEEQDTSFILSPTKGLETKLNDTINDFKNKKIDYKGKPIADILSMDNDAFRKYISSLEKVQMNPNSWIKDLMSGRFEKKYGKVTTKESCIREFKEYANIIRKIYKKEIDPNILKTTGNNLQPTKNFLQACVKDFGDKITNNKDVKLVLAPPGEAYDYGLRLENKNKRDIYSKDMGLSNTINKVIMEHSDNKKRMVQESKILNNKFNFIIDNYDLNRKSERKLAFNEIRSERNYLIRLGYDKTLVKESFLEVMKNLFGESGQNPVEDFKKGLSEKLSSPIDLKVLVNEMDIAIIENAFKTEMPKDEIMNLLMEKIKEKIEPQVNVVFDNINKKMDDFRNAVGGLQV
jgi:hypothetical protein